VGRDLASGLVWFKSWTTLLTEEALPVSGQEALIHEKGGLGDSIPGAGKLVIFSMVAGSLPSESRLHFRKEEEKLPNPPDLPSSKILTDKRTSLEGIRWGWKRYGTFHAVSQCGCS